MGRPGLLSPSKSENRQQNPELFKLFLLLIKLLSISFNEKRCLMKDFLKQIELSLDHNLFLPALFCSLSLPDICAGLQSENGETDGAKYKAWNFKYAKRYCSSLLTETDCYQFRCRMLHNGSALLPRQGSRRIWFMERSSGNSQIICHDNLMQSGSETILQIDLQIFCRGMIKAVSEWFEQNADIEPIKSNYEKRFIHRRQNGLEPYIAIMNTPISVIC